MDGDLVLRAEQRAGADGLVALAAGVHHDQLLVEVDHDRGVRGA